MILSGKGDFENYLLFESFTFIINKLKAYVFNFK